MQIWLISPAGSTVPFSEFILITQLSSFSIACSVLSPVVPILGLRYCSATIRDFDEMKNGAKRPAFHSSFNQNGRLLFLIASLLPDSYTVCVFLILLQEEPLQ